MELKKIAIIGPESTGKSTLSEQLAQHYHTLWCPEFAREYLLTYGKNYDYKDLLTIAKGQIALEEEYIGKMNMSDSRLTTPDPSTSSGRRSRLLFIDTDMYVMKVWSKFVYSKCHRFILDQITERQYDLYLLCNVDLPWVKDELREYPDPKTRQELFLIYKDIMINQSIPWVDIQGGYEERLQRAVEATELHFIS